ncbi:MAG TPA: hypothetical protein GX507_06010 [Clostridia bacterium]|nr:hypothetical protein [Clostridia bacterium]
MIRVRILQVLAIVLAITFMLSFVHGSEVRARTEPEKVNRVDKVNETNEASEVNDEYKGLSGNALVRSREDRGKVVIVVVDHISLKDLLADENLQNIRRLIREGCFGFMNTVTRGKRGDVSAYVSIGSGARTAGSTTPARLTLSYEEDVHGIPAAEAYKAFTGEPSATCPQPEIPENHEGPFHEKPLAVSGASSAFHLGNTTSQATRSTGYPHGNTATNTCRTYTYRIFNLALVSWRRENANLGYDVTLGAMATALREAGLYWALLGNSDVPPDRFRPSIGIAMDDTGRVPLGEIGESVNTEDPAFPWGVRTDWNAMKKAFLDVEDKACLIVIECGDTNRIDAARPYLHQKQEARLRQAALRDVDAFLGWLDRRLDPMKDLLILLSPSPSRETMELGDSFAPIIMKGGIFAGGLLSSPTTKTPGLISNVDVAPTVLRHLKLFTPHGNPTETVSDVRSLLMFGRPAQPVELISADSGGADSGKGPKAIDGSPASGNGLNLKPEKGSLDFDFPNSSGQVAYLISMHRESLSNHIYRPAIIKGFVGAYVIILGFTVLVVELNRRIPRFLVVALSSLPLFPIVLPLVRRGVFSSFTSFMESSPAPYYSPYSPAPHYILKYALEGLSGGSAFATFWGLTVVLAAGSSLMLSAFSLRIAKEEPHATAAIPTSFIVFILLFDQLTGSKLTVDTPFGHSLMGGARYYGMGNEYMGLSTGAAAIAASSLTSFFKNQSLARLLLIALLLLNAVTVAVPCFGANFGGGIAAAAGLVSTTWLFGNAVKCREDKASRVLFKVIVAIGVVAISVTYMSLALEDFASEGALTHLGFAVHRVRSFGISEVIDICVRKMQMNLKLIKYSVWTKALVASMVTFGVMLYRPYGVFKTLQASFPRLMAGVKGASAAAFVALISNDSGVVAAAMSLVPASSAFLYAVVWTHNHKDNHKDAIEGNTERKREIR